MKEFEIIEHTADIGIRAYGGSMASLFENAAAGMCSLITDLSQVGRVLEFEVELTAADREELIVEWLNELLYLQESREVLLGGFTISEIGDTYLKGIVTGSSIESDGHELLAEVKAATYHGLSIRREEGRWMADVIFDV